MSLALCDEGRRVLCVVVFAAVILCNCAARSASVRHCPRVSPAAVCAYRDFFTDVALQTVLR